MSVRELLLIALVGWTAIGIVGVVVALVRRERVRVRKGLIWLVGVWVVYLGCWWGFRCCSRGGWWRWGRTSAMTRCVSR